MTYGIKIKLPASTTYTNTKTAYNLVLASGFNVGAPTQKRTTVDIPGADGQLDFSYAFSSTPVFNNRTITFSLIATGNAETARKAFASAWHGKKVNLILPDDENYYWTGVVSVGTMDGIAIAVTVDAAPYKQSVEDSTVKSL